MFSLDVHMTDAWLHWCGASLVPMQSGDIASLYIGDCVQEPLWTADQENTPRLAMTPPVQRRPSSLFYAQADSTPPNTGAAAHLGGCQAVSSQRRATPPPEAAQQQTTPAVLAPPARQPQPLLPIQEDAEKEAPCGTPHAGDNMRGRQLHRPKPKAAKKLFNYMSDAPPDAAQQKLHRTGSAGLLHAGKMPAFG